MADAKAPAQKNLGKEYARTGDTLGLSVSPGGVLSLWNYGILRSLAGNLEVFEEVLRDPEVQSKLQERRLALVGKDWNVDAGGSDRQSKKAADYMREILHHVSWDDLTDKMHYGVFYGFSAAELIYMRDGAQIIPDEIKVRKRTRFRFDLKGQIRLLNMNDPAEGEIMPPNKFWHFATGGDNHENPYGIGLAHWLYWPTVFKNRGQKFWSIFLDKFAMPTAVGKHDYGTGDERINQLVEALEAIHTDSGVAIPKEVAVELLEARRNGTTDYETFCKYMDASISKVVVGQVASSEGTPGRLGNEELQSDVRYDIIKADSDLICESWNRGPARWLTAWNYPNAKPPRVWREVEADEDLNKRAERDSKIFTIGFKPTLEYITETYGEGFEEKAEPVPPEGGDDVPGNKAGAPEFAAPRDLPPEDLLKDAIDEFLADDEALNLQTAQIIEPVFAMVRRSGPEKALGKLVEIYPKISHGKLTEALARAQFVAHVWGRISAQAEIDEE